MATFVSLNAKVEVNSVDVSDWLTGVSWQETADAVETTTYAGTSRTREGGLKDGSVSLTFRNDFAASAIYSTLKALVGTKQTVEYTPDSTVAVSATNPTRTVSVIVTEFNVADVSVGEVDEFSVTWPFAGAVTEVTS